MAEMPCVSHALFEGQRLGLGRLDAQLLTLHVLGRPSDERAWLVAHGDDPLTEEQAQALQRLYTRRQSGEPVAYLLGSKEFFGMELAVDTRVLVPRPDTETLVEWALEALAGQPTARVVDLGTGSGAVALALKKQMPGLEVWAVDTSEQALQVARANATRLGLAVEWVQASWLSHWVGTDERWDLIVSNPPYIREGDPHLPALAYEPSAALIAGPDGLDDIRQIISQAVHCLRPGGQLMLEHGYDQAAAVRALLTASGLEGAASRRDLQDIERCSGASLPKMK